MLNAANASCMLTAGWRHRQGHKKQGLLHCKPPSFASPRDNLQLQFMRPLEFIFWDSGDYGVAIPTYCKEDGSSVFLIVQFALEVTGCLPKEGAFLQLFVSHVSLWGKQIFQNPQWLVICLHFAARSHIRTWCTKQSSLIEYIVWHGLQNFLPASNLE